jgi:hypothetical protein
VFASDASRRFLFDVSARFAVRGEARVFQLRIGGAVVATRLGTVLGPPSTSTILATILTGLDIA